MGVCAYWRRVALHTTDLWTHVDVDSKAPNRMSHLLLERARGHPIHLHVYEAEIDENEATSDYQNSKAVEVFTSHMNNVCVLDLESYSWSGGFVEAVLNLWLKHGTGSLLRSLTVQQPNAHQVLSSSGSSFEDEGFHSRSDNAKAMLLPLGTLHLQNVQFDWKSGVYCNLIDLRLDFESRQVDIPIPRL
ncbi:hypothetical protein FRC09_010650, partial [Ceratobasidium sp. 395]